jgi:hypothetical protein
LKNKEKEQQMLLVLVCLYTKIPPAVSKLIFLYHKVKKMRKHEKKKDKKERYFQGEICSKKVAKVIILAQ